LTIKHLIRKIDEKISISLSKRPSKSISVLDNRRRSIFIQYRDNGCAPLLDVNDMILMGDKPDWKCVFTYIQSLYKHFVMMPEALAARAAAAAAAGH
jgi:hypothetical protein